MTTLVTRHEVAQRLLQEIKTNSRIIAGMHDNHSRGAKLLCAEFRAEIVAMETQLISMISEA